MSTDTKLTDLVVNTLTRKQYHDADLTDHGDELFVQSDHAGVFVGANGVDALDTTNITNCITEIPQDIKVELNNGTLTLKAGSKVYVPNGFEADGTTPKYDTVVITNDLSTTSAANTGLVLIYRKDSNDIVVWSAGAMSSGTTAPSGTTTFYNTALNKIRRYSSGSLTSDNLSLPLAYVAANSTKITTIYHIVNTIGYIGSELFSMPSVSGLIPDGFNTDGSLKNIAFTTTGVARTTVSGTGIIHTRLNATGVTGGDLFYNRDDNYNYVNGVVQENKRSSAIVGFANINNNIITGLRINTVAHIVEYNNTDFIAHQAMPSSVSVTLTTAASGTSYQAPADGYFRVSGTASAAGQRLNLDCNQIGFQGFSYASGNEVKFSCPVKKGDNLYLSYNMPQANVVIRFVYAVGVAG